MTRAMQDSISQQALPNYMAAESTTDVLGKTDEDREHNEHLALQERMRHPISFHAEMMGDIMYFQQALWQLDASHFVDVIIQEVNGHVDNKHWALVK